MEFLSDDLFRFIKFGLVGILKLNTIILYLLLDIVGLRKLIALVITTGIIMILNYFINKLLVFKKYR